MSTTIAQRIAIVQQKLQEKATLVAVSKYQPLSKIEEAYACGQRVFGESRVQELVEKQKALPKDIEWHFIGHLQTNKVKYIAPFIHLIHAVDSVKLLKEINKQGEKNKRVIDCLIQIHIAQEETKSGFDIEDCQAFFASKVWKDLPFVNIKGIMGMASFVENEQQIAEEFDKLHTLFIHFKQTYFQNSSDFLLKSWGMTGDYTIALQHGSNMVRIGTYLFGER